MEIAQPTEEQLVQILYTNWEGKTELRTIVPSQISFMKTVWHPEEQWVLLAWCCNRKADRIFAIKDIKEWIVPKL